MPNFVEVRLRLRQEKLGTLVVNDLPKIPYVQWVGTDVVGHTTTSTPRGPKGKRGKSGTFGTTTKAVFKLLEDAPKTRAEISADTKLPTKTIHNILGNHVAGGSLKRNSSGKYTLTSKGRMRLNGQD